jgi:hypothetical protein
MYDIQSFLCHKVPDGRRAYSKLWSTSICPTSDLLLSVGQCRAENGGAFEGGTCYSTATVGRMVSIEALLRKVKTAWETRTVWLF